MQEKEEYMGTENRNAHAGHEMLNKILQEQTENSHDIHGRYKTQGVAWPVAHMRKHTQRIELKRWKKDTGHMLLLKMRHTQSIQPCHTGLRPHTRPGRSKRSGREGVGAFVFMLWGKWGCLKCRHASTPRCKKPPVLPPSHVSKVPLPLSLSVSVYCLQKAAARGSSI